MQPIDFTTAEKWDLDTSAYTDLTSLSHEAGHGTGSTSSSAGGWFASKCRLEAIAKTGKASGEEYEKALAECKATSGGTGLFAGLSCDSECRKKGTKAEDMTKCIAQCQLNRREKGKGWMGNLQFGNIFGLGGKTEPDTAGVGGKYGDEGGSGIMALVYLILIIGALVGVILLITHLTKKKEKGEGATK